MAGQSSPPDDTGEKQPQSSHSAKENQQRRPFYADVSLLRSNPDAIARADRLKTAVKDGGGNLKVSELSGVPLRTLTAYLNGGEMKLSNAIALAEATGKRVEWLATGRGPRDAATAEAAPSTAADPAPTPSAIPIRDLFENVNIDRLADAFSAARQLLATRGHRDPEPRRLLQVTVILYDEMTAAEAEDLSNAEAGQRAVKARDLE